MEQKNKESCHVKFATVSDLCFYVDVASIIVTDNFFIKFYKSFKHNMSTDLVYNELKLE